MLESEGDPPRRMDTGDTRSEIQQLVADSVAMALRARESETAAGGSTDGDTPTSGATPRRETGKRYSYSYTGRIDPVRRMPWSEVINLKAGQAWLFASSHRGGLTRCAYSGQGERRAVTSYSRLLVKRETHPGRVPGQAI